MSKSNMLINLEKKKEPFTKRKKYIYIFSITRTKLQYYENTDLVKFPRKVYEKNRDFSKETVELRK